ncbi:MAG: hypothetical protein IJY25_06690 [Bacilli bacterium]|nr:hypothetical protein [Bacilli bacterium]
MDKLSVIDGYLGDLGVNVNVINYMRQNKIFLNKYFEDMLGKDFYMWNDEFHKKEFCQKLKSGSEKFKIFDNGGIWFSSTRDPKIETSPSFARNKGFLSESYNKRYDEIRMSDYISFENGNITRRYISQSKQTKDNQVLYDGTIGEEKQEVGSKSKTQTIASFTLSTTPIPTETLKTRISTENEFGTLTQFGFGEENYDNSLWHLVSSGKVKNQDLIENLNPERISAKEKFRLIKQNIFAKVKAKNQTELFEQLRGQYMDLLTNESLDEIIHSEFSMKGKESEVCTWTLEKVTELSRDIVFQMDFQNTEQFRQQILQPLLVDYAQTNSIIQGRVKPTDTGLSQYRAFSTTNNVVTLNNVSEDYANYISTEIQKVEPIMYNKQMDQKEKEYQQENGLGYQKINKKNSGFLDVLLLASIVGYVSGLILFIMVIILRNNI